MRSWNASWVRRVGVNVNQIAFQLNASASASENPRGQGRAAKEAAELVRAELVKLAAISGGNLARFGVRAAGGEPARADRIEKGEEAEL